MNTRLRADRARKPISSLIFGGERSLNGNLVWTAAYAEFAFCDEHLPDYPVNPRLEHVFDDFVKRERRFGGLSEVSAP